MSKAVKLYIPVSIAALAVLAWMAFSRNEARVECPVACQQEQAPQPEAEPVKSADPESPQLLGRCVARLKQARIELQGKSSQKPGISIQAGDSPEAAEAENENASAGDAGPGFSKDVNAMFVKKLELDEQQAGRLEQIVCALKELRASQLEDFTQGQTSLDTMWQELAALRKDLAADLEKILGEERYRQFREVGGIGAMGSAVDCSSVSTAPGRK